MAKPKGHNQNQIYRCEDRIAMTNEADEALCLITQHTNNPHIIREVKRGRSYLARLWDSLVDERKQLQQGTNDEKPNDHR